MSINPPKGDKISSSVHPEIHDTKKRSHEEEKIERIRKKSISREEYQPEKTVKREVEKLAPSEHKTVTDVDAVGEKVISSQKYKEEKEDKLIREIRFQINNQSKDFNVFFDCLRKIQENKLYNHDSKLLSEVIKAIKNEIYKSQEHQNISDILSKNFDLLCDIYLVNDDNTKKIMRKCLFLNMLTNYDASFEINTKFSFERLKNLIRIMDDRFIFQYALRAIPEIKNTGIYVSLEDKAIYLNTTNVPDCDFDALKSIVIEIGELFITSDNKIKIISEIGSEGAQ